MNPQPAPTQSDPATTPGTIFFGRFGLRAGWSIALFLAVYLLLLVAASIAALEASGKMHEVIAARQAAKAHPGTKAAIDLPFVPALAVANDGVLYLGLAAVCWCFARLERRPYAAYGIGANRWRDIFPGALWGVIIMSLLVALLRGLHLLVFDGQNLSGSAVLLYGLKWLLAFVCVGLAEEYEFRGYMLYTLMRGLWGVAARLSPARTKSTAYWLSGVLLSLLFALAHTGNHGENAVGIFQVFLAGIALFYCLWRTGSLWWAIGFHATWDWAQSFLYGVADSGNVSVGRLFITHPQGKAWLSGGSAGPEGSVFASAALLLTIAVVSLFPRGELFGPEQLPDAPPPPTAALVT